MNEKMSNLTPEEQKTHEAAEERRKIVEGQEGEKPFKPEVTEEEAEKAAEAAKKRQETHPYGE